MGVLCLDLFFFDWDFFLETEGVSHKILTDLAFGYNFSGRITSGNTILWILVKLTFWDI